ncbi:MAG: GNAT family N-acetyltransferase [Candidatus Nucleicultricaceae bacterium]
MIYADQVVTTLGEESEVMQKEITVVPYDPSWIGLFEEESHAIKSILQKNCIEVHHVGSTSVPGLAAKPVIDIIATVVSGPKAIGPLTKSGYQYEGEWNIPFKFGFKRRLPHKVNLHIFEIGHPEIELNLCFRDYLRSHPKVRDQYAALKYALLDDEAAHQKKSNFFRGYTLGKYDFIQDVLKAAGLNCVRFLKCSHPHEWKVAEEICNDAGYVLEIDPAHKDACRVDWVAYEGAQVVGYLQGEVLNNLAKLQVFVVTKAKQGQGLGRQFLLAFERWCKAHGFKELYIEDAKDASLFFKGLCYLPTAPSLDYSSFIKRL